MKRHRYESQEVYDLVEKLNHAALEVWERNKHKQPKPGKAKWFAITGPHGMKIYHAIVRVNVWSIQGCRLCKISCLEAIEDAICLNILTGYHMDGVDSIDCQWLVETPEGCDGRTAVVKTHHKQELL